MKIKLPLTLALIALCSISAHAQQPTKPTYRVSVGVSAKDDIKSDITSYVSRELRSLSDIVIVDSTPQYIISIVGIRAKTEGGRDLGYDLSVTVTELNTEEYINALIPECLSKDDWRRSSLSAALAAGEDIKQHFLVVGSDLRKLSSDLVATIDGEVFEQARKSHQSIMDMIQKYNQQQQQKPSAPARSNPTKKPI